MLALSGTDLVSAAKSTCRFHHYFAELSAADAQMNPLERLLISLVLTQREKI
jgi:hypothetical protein